MRRLLVFTTAAIGALALSVPAGAAGSSSIAALQVALHAHGFYPAAVDGVQGPLTTTGLTNLQRVKGIPVTGRVERKTRSALGSLGRPLLGQRELAVGAVGWDVSSLEFRLIPYGLDPTVVDGRFTAATAGALARFQAKKRLAADGIAGKLTRGDTSPAERVLAGTLFAEHTFTRLLGPPDQRKVTALAAEGYPAVPEARYHAPVPTTAGDPPDGGTWLDELAPDATEHCFTLDQTDSNQHVNSLNYIRLFQDAANRRFAAAGMSPKLRSREVDIAYRKPCFAGDRVRCHLRLFALGDAFGVAGFVASPGEEAKPRCYVRVLYGA